MTFRPESVRATVSCARISVILIYLLLAMAVVSSLMKTPKQEENHEEASDRLMSYPAPVAAQPGVRRPFAVCLSLHNQGPEGKGRRILRLC